MKVQIKVKEINTDYSQDWANEYQFGMESESNKKHNWEVGWQIDNVKSVEFIDNGIYELECKGKNGADVKLPIQNVAIFRCHLENLTDIDFGVSKSILNKTHQARNEKYNSTRCYFYINSKPPGCRLGKLVINSEEIPKELAIINE